MPADHLPDVLRARADRTPDAVAYETVGPSGQVTALTYAQLASRAAALAAQLAGAGDGPVLLAYPAGLDYPVGIFAAFLAGRPVIPAYPPGPSAPDRTRLAGIVADARPSVVIAPEPSAELAGLAVRSVPGADADGTAWRPAGRAAAPDLAIIQYTSGSTGRPRGVLVRHDSVAANTAAIAGRLGLTPASRGVTWLPPYHDMGLIGGLLTPIMAGFPARILRPADFVKAPLWWLRQITESGATASGAPNFGYELCVRRARSASALAGLDLSRWQVAFSGGESVKERTMAEFAAAFAPAGFRREAFLPCYGLAEATLIVSAGHWSPADAPDGPVSCGPPVSGQQVVIVDPDRLVPADDGAEGEIWITGPHVTAGYLSGSTAELFGELGGVRYLRTGDLGYLRDGELFLTGRAKDVIVFRGVNYHASDVETAALAAAGPVARTAAAFSVDAGPEAVPVLILEVRGTPDESLARSMRAAVLAQTRLRLGLVALVPLRSVPRTSSGKIRRSACRDALLAGAFDRAVLSDPAVLAALTDGCARTAAAAELAGMICGIVAGVCDAENCQPADRLADLGVDSVQAAEAAAVLEDALGLTVPLDTVLAAPTPQAVADALLAQWQAEGCASGLVRDRLARAAGAR